VGWVSTGYEVNMAANALVIQKSYSNENNLSEADIDNIRSPILQWATDVVNNFNQITTDAFGSTYALDNDGNSNLTASLFAKQNTSKVYTAAVINLGTGTDVAFVDADTTNAELTFTPELAGDYRVTAHFTVRLQATAAAAPAFFAYYRLNDNTNTVAATAQVIGWDAIAAAGQAEYTVPVCLSQVFTLTAVSTTIRLQKRVTTATNIGTHEVYANAIGPTGWHIAVEKI